MRWVILIITLTVAIFLAVIAWTLESAWQGILLAFALMLLIAGLANLYRV